MNELSIRYFSNDISLIAPYEYLKYWRRYVEFARYFDNYLLQYCSIGY